MNDLKSVYRDRRAECECGWKFKRGTFDEVHAAADKHMKKRGIHWVVYYRIIPESVVMEPINAQR